MDIITDYMKNKGKITEKKQPYVDSFVNNILYGFEYSPSYYKITKNEDYNTFYDTWILDSSKAYRLEIGKKKIIMKPNQPLAKGEYINWNSQKWIVTAIDPQVQYYNNGEIKICNYLLKWIDKKTNKLCQQWCIVENKKKFTTGLDENTAIIVGDGDFQLTLPTNEFTKRIKRDDRFLISTNTENPQSYKVSRVDNTSNPDLILVNVMEKGAELTSYDDKVNMIPDYYKYFNENIKIQVNNPISQVNNNSTYQLNVKVTNGTDTITPNLTYISSDTNIATVDANGLINSKNIGNVVISISLTDLPNIKVDIPLNITSGITDNYSISITGGDILRNTLTSSYTASVLNNGIADTTKTVIWSVSDTTKAQIVSQDGTAIKLKGLTTSGTITLTATLSNNPLIETDKIITLKTPF